MRSVLLGPPALERGYFDPDYIRRLIHDHDAGANHAVRIGALLSLELWHQMFIDQNPPRLQEAALSQSLLREKAMVA